MAEKLKFPSADVNFVWALYKHTITSPLDASRLLEAPEIAELLYKDGFDVSPDDVQHIWSEYGGKKQFIDRAEASKINRKQLARKSKAALKYFEREAHKKALEMQSPISEEMLAEIAQCTARYNTSLADAVFHLGFRRVVKPRVLERFVAARYGSVGSFQKEFGF